MSFRVSRNRSSSFLGSVAIGASRVVETPSTGHDGFGSCRLPATLQCAITGSRSSSFPESYCVSLLTSVQEPNLVGRRLPVAFDGNDRQQEVQMNGIIYL